ncbi:MAG: hypothetical protein QXQ53_04710 [Candidatus Methanosuratincola sp.]
MESFGTGVFFTRLNTRSDSLKYSADRRFLRTAGVRGLRSDRELEYGSPFLTHLVSSTENFKNAVSNVPLMYPFVSASGNFSRKTLLARDAHSIGFLTLMVNRRRPPLPSGLARSCGRARLRRERRGCRGSGGCGLPKEPKSRGGNGIGRIGEAKGRGALGRAPSAREGIGRSPAGAEGGGPLDGERIPSPAPPTSNWMNPRIAATLAF